MQSKNPRTRNVTSTLANFADRWRRRPKWSLATSFWFCTCAVVVVVPLLLLIIRKSVWVEMEIATAVLAALMFAYFGSLLYLGVRFDTSRRVMIDWPVSSPSEMMHWTSYLPDVDVFSDALSDAGCLGIVFGLLLDVTVMFVLALLVAWFVWIGVNVVVAIVLFLYWVHNRWLRYLVTRGRHCRGNWRRSILHSGITTLLYSFWFYTAFFFGHKISQFIQQ